MPRTFQHNFAVGTVILDQDGDKCQVLEPDLYGDGKTLHVQFIDSNGDLSFTYEVEVADVKGVVSTPTANAIIGDAAYNFDLAEFAQAHAAALSFRYEKAPSKPLEARRVVPDNIYTKNGNTIIVGNDPDRQDVRAFRLDRIRGKATV